VGRALTRRKNTLKARKICKIPFLYPEKRADARYIQSIRNEIIGITGFRLEVAQDL
jgi:hypothetical protein